MVFVQGHGYHAARITNGPGGPVILTHNNLSYHPAFKTRLNRGSNARAGNQPVNNLARFIIYKFRGHYRRHKENLKQMVNHIIEKRLEDQDRFKNQHMKLVVENYHTHRNYWNNRHKLRKEQLASTSQLLRQLNAQIHATRLNKDPTQQTVLIAQRNALLNANAEIRRIKARQDIVAFEYQKQMNILTRHAQQIAVWRWVKQHVIPRVNNYA
jgi:hypothetical protein